MTRREGLLRVNLLAPVAVLLRREAGHRCTFDTIKLDIARDPTDRFGRNPHNFEALVGRGKPSTLVSAPGDS